MKNLFLFIISIILCCSLFHSCGKSENTKVVDSTSLSVALLPTMDNLPLYYAKETGIFDSLGLDIQLCTYSSAMDCDTAFTNGRADGVVSDIVKANIWRSKGDSVKIVMSTDLNLYLITTRVSRIKSLKSIKEKIIAITRHSAVDYMADKVLEHIGLDLLQLNRPQINDIILRCNMTENNQYDGAFLSEPYAIDAVSKGANRLISSSDIIGNLSAVIVHDSIISKRNEDIRKLVQGYNIAVERINSSALGNEKLYLSYIHNSFINEIPDTIISFSTFKIAALPDSIVVSSTAQWAKSREQMMRDVSLSELVDSSFVK